MLAGGQSGEIGTMQGRGRTHACPSRSRPVDLVHLAGQTMGDRALEREVLGMLGAQVDATRRQMSDAPTDRRAALAHAIAGSARNVGAFALAAAASALEQAPRDEARRRSLEDEMTRVERFLAALCGPGAMALTGSAAVA